MSKVYILGAKRTAVGSFLGALKDVSAAQLGATAVKGALDQAQVDVDDIDEVIIGNVLPAGQGQGIARQVSLGAGIPNEICAYAVNMVCGSGMKAVMNAYTDIKAEMGNLVVAGGAESMSQAPYLVPASTRQGYKMGDLTLKDHMVYDALTDAYNQYHMGVTAENIVDKYGITRQEQDEFAYSSQTKAIEAIDAGSFKDEIVPVETKVRRDVVIVDTDEYPNRKTNLDKLSGLRAAFAKDGTVTAGNASGINDGGSAVVVASEAYVKEKGLKPLVEVVAVGQGGVDPKVMGLGPTPAIINALKSANLTLDDIDVLELNEAFAAQSLGVVHELVDHFGVDRDKLIAKTNMNGGAIAIGHPVGASGNRIFVTLIHIMKKKGYKYGLASLCIGGGMGTCIIVKNVD